MRMLLLPFVRLLIRETVIRKGIKKRDDQALISPAIP